MVDGDDDRKYPKRPILGVGGLIFNGDELLLIKRGKDPGRGRWAIPGGAVKAGETLAEALAREMMEEVGLTVEVGPLVEMVERVFRDEDGRVMYHYVIMDYLCLPGPETPKPGSDAAELKYVPPEQWTDYGLPAFSIRILEKGRQMAGEYRKERLEAS